MIQTLMKNRWLLALCGALEAIISFIYVAMYENGQDGSLVPHWNGTVVFLSKVTFAAGACMIAAFIWRPAGGKSWPLLLNGVALSAFGLLPLIWKGPLGFNVFALLVVVMAIALGILALAVARTLRHRVVDEWSFALAGAASLGFAVAFFALASGWIPLERRPFHPAVFLWLCVYFGFSAICMLGLFVRLPSLSPRQDLTAIPHTNF